MKYHADAMIFHPAACAADDAKCLRNGGFMKKIQFLFLLTCLSCLLCACRRPEADILPDSSAQTQEEALITFTDDLGRTLQLSAPGRVVASIGSFADIWCLAGGKETLVATASDAWTSFDLDLDESVINIGSVKDPSFEALLGAKPDLVIASTNTEANLTWRDPLEQAGIAVAYFNVEHFSDYLRMLQICTQLTGCPDNYTRFGTEIQARVDAAIAQQDGSAPTVLYVRASGSSCKVKGSTGNVLGEMLADLGCVNIADSDRSLLETLSLEAILTADPDFIFAVLQGADPTDAEKLLHDTLLDNPAWQQLTAVKENRFYTMDPTLYNLKPNARWGEAYENLAAIVYPKEDR